MVIEAPFQDDRGSSLPVLKKTVLSIAEINVLASHRRQSAMSLWTGKRSSSAPCWSRFRWRERPWDAFGGSSGDLPVARSDRLTSIDFDEPGSSKSGTAPAPRGRTPKGAINPPQACQPIPLAPVAQRRRHAARIDRQPVAAQAPRIAIRPAEHRLETGVSRLKRRQPS